MCVSFTGMIALDSLRFFKDIAYELHRSSFYFDAVNCVQFSLLRGLFAALKVSLARLKDDGWQKRSLETEMLERSVEDEEWQCVITEMQNQTKPKKNQRVEQKDCQANEEENEDSITTKTNQQNRAEMPSQGKPNQSENHPNSLASANLPSPCICVQLPPECGSGQRLAVLEVFGGASAQEATSFTANKQMPSEK